MSNQNRLGDAPIEERYQNEMRFLASALDKAFNGDKRGPDRDVGFVLLVFPFGDQEGRCNYISNGADRRDIAKLLEEQAKRFRDQIAEDEKSKGGSGENVQ